MSRRHAAANSQRNDFVDGAGTAQISPRTSRRHTPSIAAFLVRVSWLNTLLDAVVLCLIGTYILTKEVFYATSIVALPTLRGVLWAAAWRISWAAGANVAVSLLSWACAAACGKLHVASGVSQFGNVAKGLYFSIDTMLFVLMGLHLDNEEVKHNLRNEGVSLNRELGFGLGEVLQCAAVVSVLYWTQRRVHRWAWELVTDPKHAPRRLYGVEIVPPAPRGLGGLSHVRACGVWAAKLAGWLAAAVVVSYLITCMGVYSTNPHVRTAGLPWASHGRGRMGQGGNSSTPLFFYRESSKTAEDYARIHTEFRDKGHNADAARFVDPTQPNGVYDDLVARVSKPVDPKSLPAKRKHLVLIVSDSLRQKDWHNTSAPRMHAMCEQREDCFMSPQHYANAWGSDQGMFTLWYALMLSHFRPFEKSPHKSALIAMLKAHGYHVAVKTHSVFTGWPGYWIFDQMDHYREVMGDMACINAGLKYFDEHKDDGPMVLLIFLHDTHSPYTPKGGVNRGHMSGYDRYKGAVRFLDDKMLDTILPHFQHDLDAENMALVLTSDHGEQFSEYGGKGHGARLPYEEVLAVPLVMITPGRPVRLPSTAITSHYDLLPSLMEYAGLPVDIAAVSDGRSLFRHDATPTAPSGDGRRAGGVLDFLSLADITGEAAVGASAVDEFVGLNMVKLHGYSQFLVFTHECKYLVALVPCGVDVASLRARVDGASSDTHPGLRSSVVPAKRLAPVETALLGAHQDLLCYELEDILILPGDVPASSLPHAQQAAWFSRERVARLDAMFAQVPFQRFLHYEFPEAAPAKAQGGKHEGAR